MNTFVMTESEQDIKPGEDDIGKSMISIQGSVVESPQKPHFLDSVKKSQNETRGSFDPKAIPKTKENQCHWCKASFGFFVKKNRTNCSQCGFSVCQKCLHGDKITIESKSYKVCVSCFAHQENHAILDFYKQIKNHKELDGEEADHTIEVLKQTNQNILDEVHKLKQKQIM